MTISVIKGDILTQEVDCIINPANPALTPGGGLCGKIFNLVPYVFKQQDYPLGLHPGECTRPYPVHGQPFKHVIHAVGPTHEAFAVFDTLERTYYNCFYMCGVSGFESIAVPLISTGIYGVSKIVSKAAAEQAASHFKELNIIIVEF